MHHYSLLDLSPVPEGASTAQALFNTVDLAVNAERFGYHRYWLAEHHNMPGIASAATAVVIGRVAAATSKIRVGSGGIMLPNHAPLVVAEQFGTLEALFPGRIDLGLGRAPGTDMNTARALRRYMDGADTFPQDVAELLGYLDDAPDDAPADARVRAVPGQGSHVPVWILGSSLFGAQFAASMGLPYAFASHFAPQMLDEALRTYHATFKPSKYLAKPYVVVAAGVCAADTDDEAHYLRTSQMLSFARLRTGQPGKLPPPVRDLEAQVPAQVLGMVHEAMAVSAVGGPDAVHRGLSQIVARYRPDELMVTGMIHDHAARVHSFRIAANALAEIQTVTQAA